MAALAKDMQLPSSSIPARLKIPPLLHPNLLVTRTKIRCVTAERRSTAPPRSFPRAGMRFAREPCFPGSSGQSRSPRILREDIQGVINTAEVSEPTPSVQEPNPAPSTVAEIDPPMCQRTGNVEFRRPTTQPQKMVANPNVSSCCGKVSPTPMSRRFSTVTDSLWKMSVPCSVHPVRNMSGVT